MSRQISRSIYVVATFILLISLLSFPGIKSVKAATAPSHPLTTKDINKLKGNFKDLGVSPTTQDKLIEKVKKGELLDSQKPEEVAKVRDQITPSFEEPVKQYTFADGSKIVSGLDIVSKETIKPVSNSNTISPNYIDVTGYSSGSGYTLITAKVWYSDGTVNCSFYAKFELINGGYDLIDSAYGYKITTVGYSFSVTHFGITKKYESASGRARASLDFVITSFNGGYSTNETLALYVGSNSYSSKFY